MSEERKASDILLDLEKKIDTILAYIKNIDFNYKLLLSKLNQKDSASTEIEKNSSPESEIEFKNVDEEEQIEVDRNPDHSKKRGVKTVSATALFAAKLQGKKIPVQQQILNSKGDKLFFANVEVMDMSNNILLKTRTNQAGKWLVNLTPGDYLIKITKSGTASKPKIDLCYQISVLESSSSLELEPKIIEE